MGVGCTVMYMCIVLYLGSQKSGLIIFEGFLIGALIRLIEGKRVSHSIAPSPYIKRGSIAPLYISKERGVNSPLAVKSEKTHDIIINLQL